MHMDKPGGEDLEQFGKLLDGCRTHQTITLEKEPDENINSCAPKTHCSGWQSNRH